MFSIFQYAEFTPREFEFRRVDIKGTVYLGDEIRASSVLNISIDRYHLIRGNLHEIYNLV